MKAITNFKKAAFTITLFFSLFIFFAFTSGHKPSYRIYTGEGEDVNYSQMVQQLLEADVIFFGELHNNTISHWLQLELTKDLYSADSSALILGAEMLESDNQLVLDEYLSGLIRERDFEAGARLWPNHKTDYRPLVNFAVSNGVHFVATNIPRRYAALVNLKGFEGLEELSSEAKSYIPPLPVPYDPELPGYKAMLAMGSPAMHRNDNLPKAQAIKDATMAWFIAQNFSEGKRFLHFNGSYHSDNRDGIVWYLNHYYPDLKIMTIATVEQEHLDSLNEAYSERADYILVVDQNVTKTY